MEQNTGELAIITALPARQHQLSLEMLPRMKSRESSRMDFRKAWYISILEIVHLRQRKIKFLTKGHLMNFQQEPNQERDGAEQWNPAISQEMSGTNILLPTTLVCCKL